MYTVIETGGKQYRAVEGGILYIETLPVTIGSDIEFDGCSINDSGAQKVKVIANATQFTRGDKVIVFKKKRRHNYRRKNTHRQDFLRIVIKSITAV